MALESPAAVTVGTTATLIAEGDSSGGGASVEVYNNSAAAVWLGDENVAVGSRGVPLGAGTSKVYVLMSSDRLYGRVAASTSAVTTLRLSGGR